MNEHTANTPTSRIDQEVQESLYAKRQKIYPREVHGHFAWLRLAAMVGLLGIYYVLPWLTWDGHQAVLFDLPARKFYIFGLVLWPQDFFYLALLLVVAALSLFFFTAIAGRLWCGYACPQTVWTEVFMWIEKRIEGDRRQAMKLDQGPWNARKVRIKLTKHAIWIMFSLWTGFTFVGYFVPLRGLWTDLWTLQLGGWTTFWLLFYSFATWGNAGFLREQVCIYMCPYARFQSAMFDKNTLIISYDEKRGEPRGSRRKSADPRQLGLGDCIDCTLCVQVCPTGIDIRNGLQCQCIGCAACIDACDEVMEKMAYPQGLIRYTTENALEGTPVRVLRPRVIVYGLILLAVTAGIVLSIATRVPLDLDVIRDRNTLYRETNTGAIENVYVLKVINKDQQTREYALTADGIEGLKLKKDLTDIRLDSGEVLEVPVRLEADPEALKSRSTEVIFTLTAKDNDALTVSEEARFLGPIPGR